MGDIYIYIYIGLYFLNWQKEWYTSVTVAYETPWLLDWLSRDAREADVRLKQFVLLLFKIWFSKQQKHDYFDPEMEKGNLLKTWTQIS